MVVTKKCRSDCNEKYPATNEYFYKNKSSKDGLHPYCKQCTKKRFDKWQRDNMDDLEYKIKQAMQKDFDLLYVKEFTTSWAVERLKRGIEIDVMNVDNLLKLIKQEINSRGD